MASESRGVREEPQGREIGRDGLAGSGRAAHRSRGDLGARPDGLRVLPEGLWASRESVRAVSESLHPLLASLRRSSPGPLDSLRRPPRSSRKPPRSSRKPPRSSRKPPRSSRKPPRSSRRPWSEMREPAKVEHLGDRRAANRGAQVGAIRAAREADDVGRRSEARAPPSPSHKSFFENRKYRSPAPSSSPCERDAQPRAARNPPQGARTKEPI